MTQVDYLPLFTEVFGPQLIDPSKLPRASRSGFSGNIPDGQWIEWRDGKIFRAGSIEKLHALHNELKANGAGSDLRAVLAEWDCRGTARIKNEAAAIVTDILTGRRKPKRGRLHLGWAEIAVEPDESAEELACRAIDVLNEELGINLSRFETDRKFTKEETARVRASLPKPEEPDLPVDPAQPQHENQTAERPDPTPSEATDFPQPDSREVREFFVTVAAQAKAATQHLRAPGVLQIILIHPLAENVGTIYRYALDDPDLVERTTREAVSASQSGHNVYIEGRTVRRGLGPKERGGLEDTIAVFALVVDSDADKSKAWSPTVPVSLTV